MTAKKKAHRLFPIHILYTCIENFKAFRVATRATTVETQKLSALRFAGEKKRGKKRKEFTRSSFHKKIARDRRREIYTRLLDGTRTPRHMPWRIAKLDVCTGVFVLHAEGSSLTQLSLILAKGATLAAGD